MQQNSAAPKNMVDASIQEVPYPHRKGMPVLILGLLLYLIDIAGIIYGAYQIETAENPVLFAVCMILLFFLWIPLAGLRVLQPQEALVLTLFGKYVGTLRKEGFYNDQPIVKRIIATGGDTIDIDPVTGDVLVNGEVLDEPYIAEKINTLEKMGDMTYPQTVPEGCVFVMGDNRNYSTDSRWSQLGMVDERYILGHVLSVVYPFSEFGSVA